GEVPGPAFDLAPGTRESINVGDTVSTYEVSTEVTSDEGVLAERAVYFGGGGSAPFEKYTLFAPLRSRTTYLIDGAGTVVHSWESAYTPGNAVYLLENGNILRTGRVSNPEFDAGGAGGIVQEIAWDGTVVWEYTYSSQKHLQHHDIEPLPNGNVLLIAWEKKTREEMLAAGVDPGLISQGELWPDHIIEVEPEGRSGGRIVWEWHAWDHLVQDCDPTRANYGDIAKHPELINLNYGVIHGGVDMTHTNSVDYNAALDQVLLSTPRFSEVWVIDHGTTTAQAAGHAGGNCGMGGDLLYRWGNPKTYRAAGPQQLFSQHDAQWIDPPNPGAGDILVFNNGNGRPDGAYSTVDEIVPPVDAHGRYARDGGAYGPAAPAWTYSAVNPTDLFSKNISGCQRLRDGNTLICSGANGTFIEVTPSNEVVWQYVNPFSAPARGEEDNSVFKVRGYPADYPGLASRSL
ncbi:MAG: aryl-sulfate sulfotransferase, partial [Actinobacteria bacterium]|nr:aryl-sulfate sulfotransferase [Actinomycetota bacterium]MBU1943370.1 aryl-sulfate sulfotransferase [Actinomycetota bacterium]MBU2686727.1 aryl-sulfate sulfotransferase [Actinomycetota bacterium]